MSQQACAWCCEAPASVFTPAMPLCRPCHRELRRIEAEDNVIPNRPVCGDCGLIDCAHLLEVGVGR